MQGSGTQANPYIIENVTDLQAIENDLSAYYELGGNIDASATSGWNGGEGFDPIISFTGQLDGKGYTISSLYIDRPTEYYCGLIGYTDASIILKNIKMTGADITCSGTSGVLLGYDNGGGLPDIDNCSTTGSITGTTGQVGGLIGKIKGGTVDDCWSSCTVTNGSSGSQNGGLIGYDEGAAITNCYATGAVTSSDSSTGGLIGEVWDAVISKCYASGDVSGVDYSGGFMGRISSNPSISNCYARGSVTGSGSYAGGFTGDNGSGTIDDCYSTGATTGSATVGGFCGENYGTITNCFWDTETSSNVTSDGGTGKTTAQMKTQSTFTDAGWDFSTIWYMNGYPELGQGAQVYPTQTITRVTGLVHRYNRATGEYNLEISLGEVDVEVGLPDLSLVTPSASAKKEVEQTTEQVIQTAQDTGLVDKPSKRGTITEYTRRVFGDRYYELEAQRRIAEPAAPTARTLRILEQREQEVQKLEEQIGRTRVAKGEPTPITERTKRIIRESPEAQRRLGEVQAERRKWWDIFKLQ